MEPGRIEQHIDKKIKGYILNGLNLFEISESLKDDINRFMNRKDYLRISERYLLNNWNNVHYKKKYTIYFVIYSKKKYGDIIWLLSKKACGPLSKLDDSQLYNLLLLKDRLEMNKKSEETNTLKDKLVMLKKEEPTTRLSSIEKIQTSSRVINGRKEDKYAAASHRINYAWNWDG